MGKNFKITAGLLFITLIIYLISNHINGRTHGTAKSINPADNLLPSVTLRQKKGPINPYEYQKLLGVGLDVDFAKTKKGTNNYDSKILKDFKQRGINTIRIRIKDNVSQELLAQINKVVDDAIVVGLVPVVSYQADSFKKNPSAKELDVAIKWWDNVAQNLKDKDLKMSFEPIIEPTDVLNKNPEQLNVYLEAIVSKIRQTNPNRIIFITSAVRSSARDLGKVKIPTQGNSYLLVQWHFYASGPSKQNRQKLWTIGTKYEKELITSQIDIATQWSVANKIPSWVGAWMPGDYNEKNQYSIEEQAEFATFMSCALLAKNIPYAVNSDTKFYDSNVKDWIMQMSPVVDAFVKPKCN